MSETPQLAAFNMEEQRLYPESLSIGWPPPISKGEPSHPSKEIHFGHMYPQPHSIGHYPELVSIEEGHRNVAWPQQICPNPPVNLTPHLLNNIPKISTKHKKERANLSCYLASGISHSKTKQKKKNIHCVVVLIDRWPNTGSWSLLGFSSTTLSHSKWTSSECVCVLLLVSFQAFLLDPLITIIAWCQVETV